MSKKTFDEIRNEILHKIKTKKKITPTQISLELNMDYRTIKRHLIWLMGTEQIKYKRDGRKTYYYLNLNK